MSFGFIILRHVNSSMTNELWITCYDSIRRFYPDNPIMIIDDNSNYSHISDISLTNTILVQSEYPGRGELLPYYYYLRHKFADSVVILHDSTSITQRIDFSVDKYKILWTFEHIWDHPHEEAAILGRFSDPKLVEFYHNKHLWTGCFGGMSIIEHAFLDEINRKYPFALLLGIITNRPQRQRFERIIACLLQYNYKFSTLFDNIHKYMPFGTTHFERHKYRHLPIIKTWNSR